MTVKSATMIADKPFAAIFAGLALTVLVIGSSRMAGYLPPPVLAERVSEETRMLQFEDAPGGKVLVRDVRTGELIKSFGRGEGSFVRATLRALVNDRRHKGVAFDGDFRLERHAGRQLYLIDEATGRTLSLNAYGPDNAAVFAAFMSNQRGEGQ